MIFTVPYLPGKLSLVAYREGAEIGRDELYTAGETTALSLTADRGAIRADGEDLAFVTIRALDENGILVFDENREVSVKVLGGGTLLALGTADPKPDRLIPYGGDSCPLFEGTAMAVIRSDPGAKGCMVEVELENGVKTQLPIGFTPVSAQSAPVQDVKPGAVNLPLEELVKHERTLPILRQILGEMIDGPMFSAVKSMSLKKLTGMSGQTLPAEVVTALEQAIKA